VAPFVAAIALIKVVLDLQGWEPIPLSPLYTGLVAATVFLLGFLLAGTLADYKESEKLPGDLAASMETIADECLILYRDKQAQPALQCLRHVRALVQSVLGWFYRRHETAVALKGVNGLNNFFLEFEPLTQPNFIVRLKQEQALLRLLVFRVNTIKETSFVGAGYVIAWIASLLLVIALVLADFASVGAELFLVCAITFLVVYVILLIRDLDDPFEFALDGSEAGAAEVSLKPIVRLEEQLRRQIHAAEQPWAR
jgi:hypothetical protein